MLRPLVGLAAIGRDTRTRRPDRRTAGFTLVELVVVITVIVIVLALAVPSLSGMHSEARLSSATQLVNAMITRAYYLSVAENTMTAVRFMPAELDASEAAGQHSGRQHLVLYKYVGNSERETAGGAFEIAFDEYFRRVEGVSSVELPDGVWAAPIEALSRAPVTLHHEIGNGLGGSALAELGYFNELGVDFVLNGAISGQYARHTFALNAGLRDVDAPQTPVLNADDFLIVFEPGTGIRSGVPQTHRLRAYAPKVDDPGAATVYWDYELDRDESLSEEQRFYQRYSFTGVILYQREAFVEIDELVDPVGRAQAWQDYLRSQGQPFLVERHGGGLVSGMPGQE